MRRKLFVAAVCILTIPMWFSPDRSESHTNATPFAVVAFAGHTPHGIECLCGTEACICDPGETPHGLTRPPGEDDLSDQTDASDLDFGSSALLLALAFIMWTRFRA